ncbi:unnamed protein product [Linum tenue]|uniref:Aluminum-activated malate transporter n=1 Tax=Linum tenue TaxID=586396 RepID=A0AAV0NL38_9ROSI|nr:unnamed protein product [Linum tenue]
MASAEGIESSTKHDKFEEKSKERLLSRKGYSEFGFNNSQDGDDDDEEGGNSNVKCGCFRSLSDGIVGFFNGIPSVLVDLYRMGKSDPRKVFFAIKMGLSLATVSMLMIMRRHLNDASQYSIWAIITVVVVFEFTVGGTLSKGLNRGLGTFSAGALALGNAELSVYFGKYQEVAIIVSIFISGSDDPVYSGYRSAVQSTSQEEALLGFAIWEPPHGRYGFFCYPWQNYVKVSGALRHCAFMVMAMHGCILSEIQAPPEKRKVFAAELQRVGNEGAKVLRELGTKLEKMEKLSPGPDLLLQVHEAAEELQTKVDLKSYLLVNSESWAGGKQQPNKEFENEAQDGKDEEGAIHSINDRSSSLREWTASCESIQQPPLSWPRISFVGGPVPNLEQESKVYESASSLSLATFASLLIEFVARLQNLVDEFQELGEKARFKDVEEEQFGGNVARPGFWTRLKRCFVL